MCPVVVQKVMYNEIVLQVLCSELLTNKVKRCGCVDLQHSYMYSWSYTVDETLFFTFRGFQEELQAFCEEIRSFLFFFIIFRLGCLFSLQIFIREYRRYQRHQRYRWQIYRRCSWHRWYTLTCQYLREFSKKIEMILKLFAGSWGEDYPWWKPDAKRVKNTVSSYSCSRLANIFVRMAMSL